MAEQNRKRLTIDDYVSRMRQGSNSDAIKAANALRRRGWKKQLWGALLRGAKLENANLREFDLSGATLWSANLSEANLSRAILANTDFGNANLYKANLTFADLSFANFRYADLRFADLTNALCDYTVFAHTDLSTVRGLETISHRGPSTIGVDTLYKSKGKIPEVFLRGCGVPKEFIEFTRGLFGENAIEFHRCFISYSHKDAVFPQKLHDGLYNRGVNNWIDFSNLRGGDFWADEINWAIHHYEKLVVCCSENSLHSLGVDQEVNTALRIEERIYRQTGEKVSVIIPVDIDGYVHKCENQVARRLQERHIINAQNWQNDFEAVLSDVLKALRTDEGRETPPEPKL